MAVFILEKVTSYRLSEATSWHSKISRLNCSIQIVYNFIYDCSILIDTTGENITEAIISQGLVEVRRQGIRATE